MRVIIRLLINNRSLFNDLNLNQVYIAGEASFMDAAGLFYAKACTYTRVG